VEFQRQWEPERRLLASFGPADAWKCFLQQYAAVFIATPYIILNSAYDMWQITTDLSLGCVPSVVGDSSSLHAELPPIFQRFASGLAPSACVCVCVALMVIVVVLAASRDSCSAMNHAQASHVSTPCSQQETTWDTLSFVDVRFGAYTNDHHNNNNVWLTHRCCDGTESA
jgi:hypothetical protein